MTWRRFTVTFWSATPTSSPAVEKPDGHPDGRTDELPDDRLTEGSPDGHTDGRTRRPHSTAAPDDRTDGSLRDLVE